MAEREGKQPKEIPANWRSTTWRAKLVPHDQIVPKGETGYVGRKEEFGAGGTFYLRPGELGSQRKEIPHTPDHHFED